MSLRIVVDTNLRYSAQFHGGSPRKLVDALRSTDFVQLISAELIDELREVFMRKDELSASQVEAHIADLLSLSQVIHPTIPIQASRDPDDDRVLECAVVGNADFIITGDKDLLVLDPFQGVRIVTVRQFLDLQPLSIPHPKQLP